MGFSDNMSGLMVAGMVPYTVHLSGGNEDQLKEIFDTYIHEGDWVFGTHRSHYHYLLSGGKTNVLEDMIMNGKSMFIFGKRFFTSSLLAGTVAIAAGVALALKLNKSNNNVWCFIGDGAEEEGHFYEAVRFVDGRDLPCTFIIEDNDRSVKTPKSARYDSEFKWPECVMRYKYEPTWNHGGPGKWKK